MLPETDESLASSSFQKFYNNVRKSHPMNKDDIPCKNSGKNAMKKTKKMDMIQCSIQSKTGMRL